MKRRRFHDDRERKAMQRWPEGVIWMFSDPVWETTHAVVNGVRGALTACGRVLGRRPDFGDKAMRCKRCEKIIKGYMDVQRAEGNLFLTPPVFPR